MQILQAHNILSISFQSPIDGTLALPHEAHMNAGGRMSPFALNGPTGA
jgi:hypothetical protein